MKVSRALLWIVVLGAGSSQAATTSSCRSQLAAPAVGAHLDGATGIGDHTLAIYYVVPTDIVYDSQVLRRLKQGAADVQAWYQCATSGYTWDFALPDTVVVYFAQHDHLYYKNNGDWWGSLLGEMGTAGLPIWGEGTVTALWAQGAGWWAGAAQGCLGNCGVALLGVELFPEFNNPAYSGGDCTGTGAGAWPCTPLGAWAHELGHTLGLPHPADVAATSSDANHSVMQTEWDYPDYATGAEDPWGFLSLELQTIIVNPFMKWGVPVAQTYRGCDVVNLPSAGAAPVAAFNADASYLNKFAGTNTSMGATSYWMFGDGAVAFQSNTTHYYKAPGTYVVTLRTMAANAMVDTASFQMPVTVTGVPISSSTLAPSCTVGPNPFVAATTIRYTSPTRAAISVLDAAGRRIRSLGLVNGSGAVPWDGRDDQGRIVPAGIYFVRVAAGVNLLVAPVARLRLR